MGALSHLRVLDLSTVLAGPGCARHLADFGADVIKVERPGASDSARTMGWRDPIDGQSLFSKSANRNKRCIELDLTSEQGHRRLLQLVATADVLIENMRPGKLEALGLGPEVLLAVRPSLVIARITAFGQDGPYKDRPGFATLAEAMSGFAGLNGAAAGAPTLPPIALTDEVTALAAAFAVLVAVQSGVGQVVDVNLLESLLQLMGPLPTLWLQSGILQPRLGSGLPYTAPRGTYLCSDDTWVAVSTSADSVADRVMKLIGLDGDRRVVSGEARMENREFLEERLTQWIGVRTSAEVLEAFLTADAACAPIYDMEQLCSDEHVRARGIIVEAEGYPMTGPVARLSATPAEIGWPGRPAGTDTAEVLAELDAGDRS